uniref:GNAT family N-acetyltransferase n=1 Tax=Sporosarcina sp. FSL K6-1522 TaxID=2921554 RepID=UPI00406C6069
MMIHIIKANPNHVEGIAKVCRDGYWATYSETYSEMYIEGIIKEFYSHERILKEVTETSKKWGGYFIAVEENEVIGAGGGGMVDDTSGEVFVLYLNPARRNEGIGTRVLDAITKQQKEAFHAKEQWVSVAKGNMKGIPFYEAKGFIFNHECEGDGKVDGESYISLRYCRKI